MAEYYAQRASAGIIITEATQVSNQGKGYANTPGIYTPEQTEGWKLVTNAVHQAGSKMFLQLWHVGRVSSKQVNGLQPIGPSAIPAKDTKVYIFDGAPNGDATMIPTDEPREMTRQDILTAIEEFRQGAANAIAAGFDGVEIIGSAGYLLSTFLVEKTNQRQDQWGGSLENRARIIRRIIVGVREVVGSDFPIGVKLNSADFQKGGFSLEDCITVARWLGEDGVDLLEISGGTYEQLSLIGVEPTDVRESTRKREAYFIEYAEQIKKSAQIPVMITGGFRSRDVMEQAVAKGEVDLVGLARPLCTEPDCSTKLLLQSMQSLDCYENKLVLGSGFWGNNSPSNLIKAINSFGQVGFYYWQIIRLSKGLTPEPKLGTFMAFLKHMTNDFKLNIKRKFG